MTQEEKDQLKTIEELYTVGIGNRMHIGEMRGERETLNDIHFMLKEYVPRFSSRIIAHKIYNTCLSNIEAQQVSSDYRGFNKVPF